jgi:hypothetical protein
MTTRGRLALGSLLSLLVAGGAIRADGPATAGPSIDRVLASRCFQEVKAISDRDGGAMWGAPLYGATLLVDEATREVVANRPDYKNVLAPKGDVFVGTLPSEENVANTSVKWLGISWTMVRWPLPEEPLERDRLLIHESFHRIQETLGLAGPDTACDHLDTRDGRVWIQLEWRALKAALQEKKEARKRSVQDALLFRAYRRSLFPEGGAREQALEMHEGIPEYTGVALATKDRAEALAYAAAHLGAASTLRTFVRSFAYLSGPAYGLLLDEAGAPWRKGLKDRDDLGELLAKALAVTLPADLKAAALARAGAYGGTELMASEDALATKRRDQLASLKAKLVDGPVLVLPVTESFNYSFDPTEQIPLEGWGTVYPYIRVSSSWGILEATRCALLVLKDSMVQCVRIPAPKDPAARPLQGDGWKLELKPGWEVAPAERPGDLAVKRARPQPR